MEIYRVKCQLHNTVNVYICDNTHRRINGKDRSLTDAFLPDLLDIQHAVVHESDLRADSRLPKHIHIQCCQGDRHPGKQPNKKQCKLVDRLSQLQSIIQGDRAAQIEYSYRQEEVMKIKCCPCDLVYFVWEREACELERISVCASVSGLLCMRVCVCEYL